MTLPEDDIAALVVRWQKEHGRNHLPWQNTRDPYRVWLSEVMLQQTQVATVLDYYARFLDRFPDVRALAEAPQDDVLALWSGLGYYSRARNLHACARQVVERFGGQFPRTVDELASLPGIGRSTAGAIASFCFGVRAAILDANVRRVLTRVLGFDADLAVARNERLLWDKAEALLPTHDLAETMPRYTQGLMDLGASLCSPRKPACIVCPLHARCVARREGNPEDYPVRTRKLTRSAQAWWLLLQRDAEGRLWLQRRPQTGIWAGLYCPPVFEDRDALEQALVVGQPPAAMDSMGPHGAGLAAPAAAPGSGYTLRDLPVSLHVLTHRDLHLHPVLATGGDGAWAGGSVLAREPEPTAAGSGWFSPSAWAALGLPAPIRKLLDALPSP
ncbi:A/G-specific adenine glycosylase [Acidovorax sp. Leaf160]|uniref:A/G-specific adenine glycosylase n=1 Tax=Acidovorax sp. Leaf160 TaxID=1736280 RepID=UPI0006F9DDD7|nr:A/G-specific adenine glycosylase [Acidovorax sp. Leaf160]KQR50182.1 A/G-specific adenine glycosylase [Acidovorax sp. Leaf160]